MDNKDTVETFIARGGRIKNMPPNNRLALSEDPWWVESLRPEPSADAYRAWLAAGNDLTPGQAADRPRKRKRRNRAAF